MIERLQQALMHYMILYDLLSGKSERGGEREGEKKRERERERECAFRLLFRGLNFVVCQSTPKTAKIGSLENIRLYGILQNGYM